MDKITGAATGNGLFNGGGMTLLIAQLKGIVAVGVYTLVVVARLLVRHQGRLRPARQQGKRKMKAWTSASTARWRTSSAASANRLDVAPFAEPPRRRDIFDVRQPRGPQECRLPGLTDPNPLLPTTWKFFAGACLLTGALVVPQAGITPALEGMGLAALILVLWAWLGPSRKALDSTRKHR